MKNLLTQNRYVQDKKITGHIKTSKK
ncbi:hypothetical protein DFO71_3104, partial [Bacillus licheniformis]